MFNKVLIYADTASSLLELDTVSILDNSPYVSNVNVILILPTFFPSKCSVTFSFENVFCTIELKYDENLDLVLYSSFSFSL